MVESNFIYYIGVTMIAKPDRFIAAINENPLSKVNEICDLENEYLRANYTTLNSVKTVFTMYRGKINLIYDVEKRELCLKRMRLTSAESIKVNNNYKKTISIEQQTLQPILDVETHLLTGVKLLDSPSYIARILGVLCLTGRRPSEIACTAIFTPIPGVDTHLLFTGQGKTKGRGDIGSYKIPVLYNPIKLTKVLNELGVSYGKYRGHPVKFHNTASKQLNAMCNKHFAGTSDYRIKPYALRSIYAEICYANLENSRIAKQKYFSKILGHGEDDNNSGGSYIDFYIVDE